MLIAIFTTIIVTLIITILAFNLKSPGKRIDHTISQLYEIKDHSFKATMGSLMGPPLLHGNKIQSLENGNQIFPAMIEAIQKAKKSITFETFIYWTGKIGTQFSEALIERSQEGVEVQILLDWVGTKNLEAKLLESMKASGIRIERYRPVRWYTLMRLNNRTHRKLLIIDGLTGFTGGVGIADQWLGKAQSPDHWRDSHFRIEGPVVAQLQAAFMDNWNASDAKLLHGQNYFPEIPSAGEVEAQVFRSSPEEGSGSVRLMYALSVSLARKSIYIASAYFVPDAHVRRLLIESAQRGVSIEIIVPGNKIDAPLARRASRASWGKLLEAGIKIYEFQPTMFHCKYMIVDDIWVSVGSTNFDNRSFRLNDECNLNIRDEQFARSRRKVFDDDRSKSRRVTLEEWRNRPFFTKLVEKIASVFSSQA